MQQASTQEQPISSLALGPAVKVSITLKMLQLLARTSNNSKEALTEEEQKELQVFSEMVNDVVEDPGPAGTVHGFCL
jgi:hypothetical protein